LATKAMATKADRPEADPKGDPGRQLLRAGTKAALKGILDLKRHFQQGRRTIGQSPNRTEPQQGASAV